MAPFSGVFLFTALVSCIGIGSVMSNQITTSQSSSTLLQSFTWLRILGILAIIGLFILNFSVINWQGNLNQSLVNTFTLRQQVIFVILIVLSGALLVYSSRLSRQSVLEAVRSKSLASKLLGGAIVIYSVSTISSALFSEYLGIALFGYPQSQFGGLILIGCVLLSVLYANIKMSGDLTIRVVASLVVSMAVFTLIETIGWRPIEGVFYSSGMQYPATTVGFRAHLAGWFTIFAASGIFFYWKRKKDIWFWLISMSAILGISATTSTSAILGTLIAYALWLVYSVIQKNLRNNIKHAVLLIAVSLVMYNTMPPVMTALSNFLGLPPASFKTYGESNTFSTRLLLWKSAYNATLQRPLLGWGNDTYIFEVYKHLSPEDLEKLLRFATDFHEEGDISVHEDYVIRYKDAQTGEIKTELGMYHSPHNILAEELYSKGFLGFFAFLSLIGSFFWYVRSKHIEMAFPIFLLILPYSIYLLAWFYVATVTPTFFIMLGMAIAFIRYHQVNLKPKEVNIK